MSDPPMFTPVSPPEAVPDFVRAGERVLWTGQPTLALLVRQFLGLGVAALFFFAFSTRGETGTGGTLVRVLPVVLFVFLIFLFFNVVRLRRTRYVLTDQGVYTRTGVIGQTVIQTTFDKITDISVKQDVLGRLLGFSALNVNTAGSNAAPVQMDGLRNALETKNIIETAREHALNRARPEPKPRTGLPRFVPDRLLLTVTCPKTRKPFRRPKAEIGTLAPCPHCGTRHKVEVKKPGRARAS